MRTVLLWVRDNLDLLKELVVEESETLDLIYIDPPFNSNRNYNMVFGETDATEQAFGDIWSNYKYKDELEEIGSININLYNFLINLEKGGLPASYLSYLTMMGIRCWYMHKLLKPTGSFYYHCDDTIGHYVRAILDYIFGINNFRNVITWQRNAAKGNVKKNYPRNSDFIFFYTKTENYTFNVQYKECLESTLKFYRYKDEKGKLYGLVAVIAPGLKSGVKEWNIDGKIIKHPQGRGFRWTQETLDRKRKEHFEKYGTELIVFTKNGVPQQIRYLEESKGTVVSNLWTDINRLNRCSKERLGYPTQKPEALLERIILASSNPGDKVADFYLGGGTTAAVAVRTGREFLGCDINLRAIQITQKRLEALGMQWGKDLIVKGVPFSTQELKEYLAYVAENSDKKNVEKFELEAITVKYYLKNVVGNDKKVGDKGVDGTFSFKYQGKTKKGIVQITSGVNTNHFKAFCGEIHKNTADLGVYICFKDQVNDNMRKFAKECGKIGNVDRLQILTFEDLLDNKKYFSLPSEDLVLS